ncbi:MAG: YtxH domain-containing protein [Segetibacter sp.]
MNSESKEYSGTDYRGTTSTDSRDLTKVVIGALAGAAAGSLIAGLFTEKGIETRKRIGEGSRNIANNLKEKVSDITEGIADKYEATKEGAANLIEKGKQKVGMSSRNTAYEDTSDAEGSQSKVLLGALAVSVAGLLIWGFATKKGTETRKRLGKNSKNIVNNLKDKFGDIADDIADKYEAAKEGAGDLIEKAKQQNDMSSGSTAYRGSTGADW